MIDDKDSVQLSEYCFGVCEALETAIQGEKCGRSQRIREDCARGFGKVCRLALALSADDFKQL
jgi:hypothetical protein